MGEKIQEIGIQAHLSSFKTWKVFYQLPTTVGSCILMSDQHQLPWPSRLWNSLEYTVKTRNGFRQSNWSSLRASPPILLIEVRGWHSRKAREGMEKNEQWRGYWPVGCDLHLDSTENGIHFQQHLYFRGVQWGVKSGNLEALNVYPESKRTLPKKVQEDFMCYVKIIWKLIKVAQSNLIQFIKSFNFVIENCLQSIFYWKHTCLPHVSCLITVSILCKTNGLINVTQLLLGACKRL